MSTQNDHGAEEQAGNQRKMPVPLELGEIVKAYTDELAADGEGPLEQRAASVLESVIERFKTSEIDLLSWKDITEKYQVNWGEESASSTAGPMMAPAFSTRSGDPADTTMVPIIFAGQWDETLYSVELVGSSGTELVSLGVKRVLPGDGVAQIEGLVTVSLANGDRFPFRIGTDGESDSSESPDLLRNQFDGVEWIELELSDEVTISLVKV